MTDISLCALEPKLLPQCTTCMRNPEVTQPQEQWQSYIVPTIEDDKCGYFWNMETDNASD